MAHTTVAIIGGGFAGLSAYRTIKRRCPQTTIALFDMREQFTWIPGLHETLGDSSRLAGLQLSLAKSLGTDFHHTSITHIQKHELTTSAGETRTFDYCVIATGSRTNFFGKTDFEQHAMTLRYPEDVALINQQLPTATHVTVVGGGFTGIEIASMLAARKLVKGTLRLIHGKERLADRMAPSVSRLCLGKLEQWGVEVMLDQKVTAITPDAVHLEDGRQLASDLTILSSGIKINDESFRQYLTFAGEYAAHEAPDIFWCGDVAIHGLYTTGHNAMLEGKRVGTIIADRLLGITRTYPPLTNRDKLAIAL